MARNTRSRRAGDDDDDLGVSNDRRNEIRRELLQMDPQEIPEFIASLSDTGELQVANEWLIANGMTPESADIVAQTDDAVPGDDTSAEAAELWREWLATQPSTPDSPPMSEGAPVGEIGAAIEGNDANPGNIRAAEEAFEDATAAAAEIWGNTGPGDQPDFSDLESMVPEGADAEQWLADVAEAGRQQAVDDLADQIQSTGDADSEEEATAIAENRIASDDLYGLTEPDWLIQMNNGMLSEQQKARYVDYWNDAYGTYLTDFDRELAPILARFDGTEVEAQDFAASVLAAQEPLIAHSIELPLMGGIRRVSYTEEQMADLRAMGYSNAAITRLVRLAANGQDNAIRQGPAGDTVDIRPLAALVRYYGGGDEFAAYTQGQREMAVLEQQLGLSPGAWRRMTAKERQRFRAELESRSYESPTESRGTAELDTVDRLESLIRQEGTREGRDVTVGILAARNNFNRGMEQYRGDELLALVYAVDPNLAQRVAATGGDPEKLDWEDNSAVYDILEQGGVIDQTGVRLRQLESSTGFFGFFETGGGSRGGGGAGPVRRVVDPEAVRSQVQQLWSRMFLADVDDATVAAITANLQQQLDAAPEGMTFDASARIEAFLKGQDVYDELYRNKPAGMAEEEYRGQFAQGVSDMLGAELDPEALKSGMRTGDYQTAVGRAASTDKLLTNSTLRGRWAQAKQVLDRFT